jgi:hypothetical protein
VIPALRAALPFALLLVVSCGPAEQRFDLDGDGAEDRADCVPEDASIFPGADDPYGDELDSDCDGGDGIDLDGDGYPANVTPESEYGPLLDCDDLNRNTHPGADDNVGDLRDSNCDGHDGTDADGDDHASTGSGGSDCDDDDPAVHPLASDPFGDSADGDCDGVDGVDADGDGHPVVDPDYEGAFESWDCNDATPAIHPGAEDNLGDGLDADCDGVDGEDRDGDGSASQTSGGADCDDTDPATAPDAPDLYGDNVDSNCDGQDGVDGDGDGYPSNVDGDPVYGDLQDCDDDNPLVHPGVVELPSDGLDNDCDGVEAHDDDGDGYLAEEDDCDDAEPTTFPGAPEAVDCVDNDCDGDVDEGTATDDGDGDGYCTGADLGFGPVCCDGSLPGDCNDLDPALDAADLDGDGVDSCGGDCDDLDGGRSPLAAEICDGSDNDCDLLVPQDELDGDGDGAAPCDGDCDDSSAAINPFDADGDGVSSCAGDCNDGDATLNPLDLDADGYSTCNNPLDCDDGDPEMDQDDVDLDGWSPCEGDCDDADASAWPGAIEDPDGTDGNCDGDVDDGTPAFDDDGDGFCEGHDVDGNGVPECSDGALVGDCDDLAFGLDPFDWDWDGWSSCAGDCDDADPRVHPDAAERANGSDDNCDGAVDEDIALDADGDGLSPQDGDCDDADPTTWPGAPEVCDGADNDCDGVVPADEEDQDRDGWRPCKGDCDDGDGLRNADGFEQCDGLDDDCDGLVDEDCSTCTQVVPAANASIQEAVDAAASGDVICVAPGTYAQTVDYAGLALHLVGLGGPRSTILDAAGAGSVVSFVNGEGSGSVLEGFMVTGGLANSGGGLVLVGSSPTLLRLDVVGNESGFDGGGGISITGGAPLLVDVLVRENEGRDGSGIRVSGSTPNLEDVRIIGNGSNVWGVGLRTDSGSHVVGVDLVVSDNYDLGIEALGGSLSLVGALIEGNQDTGLSVALGVDVLMEDSRILDNVGTTGAGIRCSGSSLQLNNVLIAGNTTGAGGAALVARPFWSDPGCTVSVVASRFVDNQAGSASTIHATETNLFLSHVAIVGNTSTSGGATLLGVNSTLTVDHTLITDNYAGGVRLVGGSANFSHSNVWGNGTEWDGLADPTGANGNISVDPQYLDTTPADPRDWDLHLSLGSPLIDAGSSASSDPDGSLPDLGAYGGPSAGDTDLDGDGAPEWWQPGPYDSFAYPGFGLDCDDLDPSVGPEQGC